MDTEGAGSTRRDMLKATGAAALGAATFFGAASAIGAATDVEVADAAGVIHIPTSITMSIDGKLLSKIKAVSVVSRSVNAVQAVGSTGAVTFRRGGASMNSTVVERQFDSSEVFRTWYAGQQTNGAAPVEIPKTVVLTLRGRNNSTVSQLTLNNAWPTSWSGPQWKVPLQSPGVFLESVKLICDSWTIA